ncbi:MAG TPA: ATP-dependent DNA helicase RecG [Acidimicrobiaceae bacterium]|nr:ATP-dependent DNA helicase RecG [Acidimicrobiaceae bacterium]
MTLAELDALPVEILNGVGPRRRTALAAVGVETVCDLLTYYPRRYVDRTRQEPVEGVTLNTELVLVGEIAAIGKRRTGLGGRRTLVEATLTDGTGSLPVVFFNQPWRADQLSEGTPVALFGKVELYRNRPQMTNPVVDLVGDRTGRVVATYPQSRKEDANLMTWEIAAFVEEALRRCSPRGIADPVPTEVLRRRGLPAREAALRRIHRPDSWGDQHPARNRLVFDEFLRVQLIMRRDRLHREGHETGIAHGPAGDGDGDGAGVPTPDTDLWARFVSRLPFELTAAQRRTIAEIEDDMATARPMHRLLQGDVGSGKTLVALRVLLLAVANGHQGALMAPTEVLAEQHFMTLCDMLGDLDVPDPTRLGESRPLRVGLLVSALGAAAQREEQSRIAAGETDVVIGTHALIQEKVSFKSLSAVVVDEQHRFGVEQRAHLRESGRVDGLTPHMLVMTATPIPRTAAMTVYGDLDVSKLDEMPPGRTPVATQLVTGAFELDRMWDEVRAEVERGRQAYVVCPLIGDSEAIAASSAEATFAELCGGELSGLRVALLHGRQHPAEKEATMTAFRDGATDVLVATTVIEVGVDVANATAMVVLSADRFGIAQLHQLRGRVGRAEHASRCWLVSDDEPTESAVKRLDALVATTDGFELAETDLAVRGEGTIFDQYQSGRSDLKLASLLRDRHWVEAARNEAERLLVSADDLETRPELAGLAAEIVWTEGRRNAEFLRRG